MSRRPAFQFYPADWRNDAALRMCPLAARGLWWEMICVMHTCEPYGHLVAAGKPIEPEELARIVGESAKDVRRWLAELERHQIFSRTDDGTIFCRRMVRDEKERAGWRDRQDKSRGKQSNVTGDVTGDVTHLSRRSSSSSASSSSNSISLRSKHGGSSKQQPAADPEGFEDFWKAYPRPTAKGAARRAYTSALAKVSADNILAATKRYATARLGEDEKFTKHPTTWLNGECWADGAAPSKINGHAAELPLSFDDRHRAAVRRFVEHKVWLDGVDGAPPLTKDGKFNPECCVPKAILAEFGITPEVSRA